MGEIAGDRGDEPRRPERIQAGLDLAAFRSREPELDEWLRRRALGNEGRASRTYVVCAANRVVGYYALAAGSIRRDRAPPNLRRNSPDPLPVMVLGRLAVDKAWEGRGIGRFMLRDAILRTVQAGEIAGIVAVLVHAISERANGFYERNGFVPSELDAMTLMIPLKQARAALRLPE